MLITIVIFLWYCPSYPKLQNDKWKKVGNKLEDQILIIKASNEKLSSDFTNIKCDMKKIDYGYTKMSSDMNEIKKIITQMMSQKHH